MEPIPVSGPTVEEGSAPDRATRRPLSTWDRSKVFLLLVGIWVLLVWNRKAGDPNMTWNDSLVLTLRNAGIWLALAGLELFRQAHYLMSEFSAGWHHFWSERVFGGWNRAIGRMNDWNRYRIGRFLKFLLLLAVLAFVLGEIFDVSPVVALFELPLIVWQMLPLILQLMFLMLAMILQFVAIFWFLSRGGVEVYMPEDIKTRFTDVWGQDPVVERVKENLVFLEDPESIEERGGYVPGGILLWGPPGTGKGQPVSALVMTPDGPRRMGDIVPGDAVVGSDGLPTRVLEVHLLGERDLFRVGFSDGTSLLVTEDHLWQVQSRYGGTKVLSTGFLRDVLAEADGRARYRIPMVAPVAFTQRDLPLHPYLLGALLGDGTFRHQLAFSNADLDVLARVEVCLPDGDGMVRKSEYDWTIIGGATRTSLKKMGLLGHYSYEKWIPDDYLWGTTEQRLDLLRGLMDTDGYVDIRGVLEFHTTSPRLADGVRHLVESFGGTVTVTTRTTRYRHGEEVRRGRPVYLTRIALPNDIVPFASERKRRRMRPRTKYFPQRRMVSIEPEGREQARCLRVEAEDHLYVTEHFIVTHNTLLAEAVAGETGKPFVFVEPGAFTNMFMGVGILKVKSLFRKLRKLAVRYGGVIAFFDEADSLGNRGALGGFNPQGAGWASEVFASAPRCHGLAYAREETLGVLQRHAMTGAGAGAGGGGGTGAAPTPGGMRRIIMGMGGGGGGMGTLQALLAELSGMKKPRGFFNRVIRRALGMRPKPPPKYRMLVMMASNMPEALDDALLRPGRIDRIYKVGYPSKEGRKRTYEGYFAKVAHDLTAEQLDRLATITPYATGATIKDLVNESLVVAIRDGRDVITWPDVIKARLLKALGPGQDVEYIERERHAIAIHEACHAVAQYHLQKHMGIDVATIEMGQGYLGMVKPIPLEEQFTSWRTEYEADIKVFLASLAGERMFFDGDNSSGVSGDLQSATTIAMYMDGFWGMGSTVGSHAAVKERIGSYPIIDGTSRNLLETELGSRIEARLGELYEEVADLLRTHRDQVLAVAHALETYKTITGEDVEAIIRGTKGPLVDGRAYHQAEFVEVAEAYHDHAVAAHQAKAGVPVALPRVAPDVLAGVAFSPPPDD